MKTRSILLTAGAIASLTSPTPSFAQKTGATLDEVVVTARRREEMVQDVPISISALSGEALAREGVQNINDISAKTPSLTITTSGASRSIVAFAIRGQRAQEVQLLTDPPVGTYFAEVVQPRPYGFGNSLYDLQSVQVLKGVQGTLFGRNMTGGAVLVEPNAPAQELQGELRGTVGNYNLREVYGMFNAPVTDSVAFRFAGKTSKRDGFLKDVSNGRLYDDIDYNAARASLSVSPSDTFESTLIVDYYESDQSGSAPIVSELRPGSTAALAGLTPAFAQQQARSEFRVDPGAGEGGPFEAFGKLPYEYYKNIGVTNKTTYEINADMTLKNVMGYRQLQRETLLDYDSTPVPTITAFQYADIDTYSEELQLQGVALDSKLDYVTGLYYFLEKGIDAAQSSAFPMFRPTVPALLQVTQNGADGRSETYAAFLAGTYAFTDELSLSAGVRYNYDARRAIVGPRVPYAGTCRFDLNSATVAIETVPLADCRFSSSKSWNAITWDTTLQWQPTADTMLYAAVRKGFRSGGYSTRAGNYDQLKPFDPENVLEYEIGAKNTADLGNFASLRTSAAVFYQDYTDVQKQRSFTITTPQVLTYTIINNTAKQVNSGGELEAALDFHNGLTASLFYAYVGIDVKKGLEPGEYQMFGSPHNQLGATINYMADFAAVGELNVNLNAVYRGKTPLDDFDLKGVESDYMVANFRASLDGIAGTGFGAALFVNNLTDERYRIGGIGLVKEVGTYGDIYGEPRMFGGEVSYKF